MRQRGRTDFADYVGRVRRVSQILRAAIEHNRDALIALRQFPHGSCGDASMLLGEYLHERGLGTWTYVAGERADGWTHGWIERAGLIADITADQFAEVCEPTIVTTEPAWHAQFSDRTIATAHAALIDAVDPHSARLLRDAYDQIVSDILIPGSAHQATGVRGR